MKDTIIETVQDYCRMRKWRLNGVLPIKNSDGSWNVLVYLDKYLDIDTANKEIAELLKYNGFQVEVICFNHKSIFEDKNYHFCRSGDMYLLSIYYDLNGSITDFSIPYTPKMIKQIIEHIAEDVLSWELLVSDIYGKVAPERIPPEILRKAKIELPRLMRKYSSRIQLTLKALKK